MLVNTLTIIDYENIFIPSAKPPAKKPKGAVDNLDKESLTPSTLSATNSPNNSGTPYTNLRITTGLMTPPPNINEFCNFFDSLTKDQTPLNEVHHNIINASKHLDASLTRNPQTDSPITAKELMTAVNKLKLNKSSGPDSIPNEVIKASAPIMLEILLKLFNSILNNGVYPPSWNKAYLSLLHKKENPLDPSNYRGISITSCLSKLFNSIINERLLQVLETKLTKVQHGFTAGRRTSDPLLILKTLLNKHLSSPKGKLFSCFVDYEKAFDTVWRPGLFYKLQKLGIGSACFNLIKSMYSDTSCQLKFQKGLSKTFSSEVGVKQGDNLSPTLFNIYINDLPEIFDDTCSPPSLTKSTVPCLLFADDLLLFLPPKGPPEVTG